MVIKVSQHVDGRGRVYHPYMADWSTTSTLVDLFQNLIVLFSKEPPVYSTPASAAPAPALAPGTPLTASPQMSLGSASMSTLPHVGTPRMSSLPSVGTMSMNSLPQSVPITMSVPTTVASAAASSPRPNSAMPHSLSFARPVSSVENDLASLSVQASAVIHSAPSPGMMHSPHSPSVSVDNADHSVAKPSASKGADQHTPLDSDSGPSQNPQQQQQQQQNQEHSNEQHQNSYKFNPVAGRPPIPNLNSPVATTDPESISTAATTGGTSTMANLKPGMSASGARRYSCASESDTMSERAKRWSTTDSALSFTEDLDEEQTPLNALPTTLLASTAAVSLPIAASASVAANASSTTVVLAQSHSGAAETPITSTASSAPISSPTTAAKITASPMRAQPQSSLLDDEPMGDPQKRLLGYQLAMLDKVIKAVDKSREKHTRVNKELLDQSANLNSGAGVIAEERHQLLESQRQLSANIGVLENKLTELNEKKNEFPDVSQIKDVCQIFRGQMPAMEQLFNLAGEISAIDDTIYMLGKALNDGKLPVSVYMRQIRKLAQQQFMAKALAFKIRQLCSLDKQ
ncbi:suppressor protein stp22 of temperature-sensitive alpha-factor receptor and arginine permease [Coemansia sp. IMI 209127]|nr:suppressor protein stp22 of temperature-sensitive alpha-factor receptor and arginine permease [Coemansia sp. IMI 209127]